MKRHILWVLLASGASALLAGCPRDGPPGFETSVVVALPDQEIEIPISVPEQRLVYGDAQFLYFRAVWPEEEGAEKCFRDPNGFTATLYLNYGRDGDEDIEIARSVEPAREIEFQINTFELEDPVFWLHFVAVKKNWLGLTEWKVEQDLLCSPASIVDAGEPDEWISIIVQPQDVNVNVGGTAEFEVMASASGTLQYQWQEDDGRGWYDRIGDISNILTIQNVKKSDNGKKFRCLIVTNNQAMKSLLEEFGATTNEGEGLPEGANNEEGIVQ